MRMIKEDIQEFKEEEKTEANNRGKERDEGKRMEPGTEEKGKN